MTQSVMLKKVRLSFPTLATPKEFKTGDGKARYSATFLIEPGSENDKLVRAAIAAEATEVLGKKADATLKGWEGNSNKIAYTDGNKKEYDGYADMMALACHTPAKQKVLILDKYKDPKTSKPREITDLVEIEKLLYAGCYVNAKVGIYVQQGEFPGLRASVQAVQFCEDGDAFSGSRADADEFSDLAVDPEEADIDAMLA